MKKLGFGLMRLPLLAPGEDARVDFQKACEMVDAFIAKGYTYFDTAYMYHGGASESLARKAIVDRYPREAFTLTSKLPVWELKKPEDMERIFAEQKEKCGVRVFDYYLLHSLDSWNHEISRKMGAYDFLKRLRERGDIRHAGFSFHGTADFLETILETYGDIMDVVQLQINYLDWEHEVIQSKKCYEVCRKFQKPIIIMEPVKGGKLANLTKEQRQVLENRNPEFSAAAWALSFTASLAGVLVILSGMSTLEQVQENCRNFERFGVLDREDYEAVFQVADMMKKDVEIPCTLCRYCVEDCPKHILIPDYFAVYNDDRKYGWQAMSEEAYAALGKKSGKPSECVACGNCERLCPQHLPVIEELKRVAGRYEEGKSLGK